MQIRRKKTIISVALLIACAVVIMLRWRVWFNNEPEAPYTASQTPERVMLTMGDRGEDSRYVSWLCGDVADTTARLCLVDSLSDTLYIPAIGEVFVSRAGKTAYYRALLDSLKPMMTYTYRAENRTGVTPWYQFRTSDPQSEEYSFLYVGDIQDTIGGEANRLLKGALARHPEVEFLACAGDLTERPMDKYWAETFRTLDSICTAMPIVNVPGNHDYLKYLIRKCERRFALVFPYFLRGMEERSDANHLFHFTYHNTDFLLFDTDRGLWYLYQQRQWLKQELSGCRSPHCVVLLHHPIYSVKRDGNNRDVRWMLNDLLSEKADLVLQGHEHAYSHCTGSEEPLTTAGCTRLPLYVISHCSPKNYRIRPSDRFYPVLNDSRYYQIISVQGDTMLLRSYDALTHERIDSVRVCRNF